MSIFIDSENFETSVDTGAKDANKFLSYYNSKEFEFVRSIYSANKEKLKKINEFKKLYHEGQLNGIEISNGTRIAFRYKESDIRDIAGKVFNKSSISNEEFDCVFNVFAQARLNDACHPCLFVTENPLLLKNRWWLESHFPGIEINIVTINEAIEIMGLYLRYRNLFYFAHNFTCNKGLWYWISFRTKIKTYNVGDPYLDALANRFIFLLMSLDQMGFQYHQSPNNDTLADTIYHFDYFILLVSGIFDNLALAAKRKYNLTFKYDNNPSRTSLSNTTGGDFLKALKSSNPQLGQLIDDNREFIQAIYDIRELVAHRESIPKSIFEYRGEDERWKATFMHIRKDHYNRLKQLRDAPKKYEHLSLWGAYLLYDSYYLDPYNFSKKATENLIKFVEDYLGLLGYTDYIEELRKNPPKNGFLRDMEIFLSDTLDLF